MPAILLTQVLFVWIFVAFSVMPKIPCLSSHWTRCLLHICLQREETALQFTLTNELLHVFLEGLHVLFGGDLVHFTSFHLASWKEESKTIFRAPHYHGNITMFFRKHKSQCWKTLPSLLLTCVVCTHSGPLCIDIYLIYPSVNHKKTFLRMYTPRTTTPKLICWTSDLDLRTVVPSYKKWEGYQKLYHREVPGLKPAKSCELLQQCLIDSTS